MLTTGLSNKADQSAFNALEGVAATKSSPDSVDLKLSNYSATATMNGSMASANNATLANYGLKTVVDQHSLDIAARITPRPLLGLHLGAVGLQGGPSAPTAYALLSAVDASSEVDSKIAAALLGAAMLQQGSAGAARLPGLAPA